MFWSGGEVPLRLRKEYNIIENPETFAEIAEQKMKPVAPTRMGANALLR
jgi:hypothetical protein